MKKTLIAAVAAGLIAIQPTAQAGGGAAGMATEFTQLANNAELLAIYVENIAQTQQKLQQYANMVQNTMSLPQQVWPSIFVQLGNLVDNIAAVEGAANASVGALTQFARHYDFSESRDAARTVDQWRTGFRNQTAEALRQIGINAGRFRDTQSAMAQIQALSQTAQGRMQVLQAGNQIAGMTVNEIQSLHSTIVSANQAQLNFMATEVQERQLRDEAQRNFMRDSGRRFF